MTSRELLLPSFGIAKGHKESQATRHPDTCRVCAVQGWTILSQVLVFLNQEDQHLGASPTSLCLCVKENFPKTAGMKACMLSSGGSFNLTESPPKAKENSKPDSASLRQTEPLLPILPRKKCNSDRAYLLCTNYLSCFVWALRGHYHLWIQCEADLHCDSYSPCHQSGNGSSKRLRDVPRVISSLYSQGLVLIFIFTLIKKNRNSVHMIPNSAGTKVCTEWVCFSCSCLSASHSVIICLKFSKVLFL